MRGCSIGLLPKKISLNGAMPLLMNISVGSSFTTIGADGTMACSLLLKNSKNCFLISLDVIMFYTEILYESFGYLCPRHCERSEAKCGNLRNRLRDCFGKCRAKCYTIFLAMTFATKPRNYLKETDA